MFFVWRKDHEDLKQLLAEREAELRHIIDLMWKQGFGVALFEKPQTSQPENLAQAAPTPDQEDELTEEEMLERERQDDLTRLASIRRTSPSRLGPALASMMSRNQARAAKAALPPERKASKVAEVFEKAKKEVS